MDQQNEPPPLQQHRQPPPGLPHQVMVHPDNPAAPYHPNNEERTMGMLIHLLGLLTGIVGPLILWLVKKGESRFIDHHGKEAINFIITTWILMIPIFVLAIFTMGAAFLAWAIFIYIFGILACVEAYKGVWHRIPMIIRLIR